MLFKNYIKLFHNKIENPYTNPAGPIFCRLRLIFLFFIFNPKPNEKLLKISL